MHLIQALKMACKSLWTNKLRSFLTMLGIIIGVVTVALLTSVASGVSSAVVSSIRTQSTLAIMMNMSDKMNIDYVDNLLINNQHKKEDADYYDYTIVYSGNAVISNNLTNANVDENFVNDYLFINTKYKKMKEEFDKNPDLYNSLSNEDKRTYMMIMSQNQKDIPTSASINAIYGRNFLDVYELDIVGEFPKESNEVLVDRQFLAYYLGFEENDDIKTSIGETFSLGVDYYTNIEMKFKEDITDALVEEVTDYIANSSISDDPDTSDVNEKQYKLGLGKIIKSNIDIENKIITLSVKYFSNKTNEDVENQIKGVNNNQMNFEYQAPTFVDKLTDEESVEITDIYDISNQKVYKISGVFDDSSSMMGGASSEMIPSNDGISFFDMYSMHNKGSIYMLLDNSNIDSLFLGKIDNIRDVHASTAYLRFKTEDVIDDRINDLNLTLVSDVKMPMVDFMLISMSSVASIISTIMGIMTTMLTVISVISLIVGGIGIMNIMLVAVTERTREIGIRKAIGAKRSAILVQFLVEALMLSIVGGLIGLGISALGCLLIGNAMGITISMPLWVIGMSLGFCTLIGLIFGMFPAVKASRMQPIDALRRD